MKKKVLFTLGLLFTIGFSTCFGQDKGSQEGLIDGSGNIIIPFGAYGKVSPTSDPYLMVENKGLEGLVDTDGRILVPCEYDHVWECSEGMACVMLDDKFGFVDMTTGKLVIPCIYKNFAGGFHEGRACVYKSGKWGFIDKTGRQIAFGVYDHYENYYNGYAQVEKNNKWGFIDKEGKEVIPCVHEEQTSIYRFNDNGIAIMEKSENGKEKYGLINIKQKEVVPCIYDDIKRVFDTSIKNAAFAVKINDKWGFLNAKGKEIIKPIYEECEIAGNHFFDVKKGDKYGIVNAYGKEVLPCEYDRIWNSRNGYAEVVKNNKRGVFNIDLGKWVAPCIYDHIGNFREGFIDVKKNGKYMCVDVNGYESFKYRGSSKIVSNGRINNTSYGLRDANGTQIVGFIYDDITYAINDLYIVRKNHKCGIINGKGVIVVPLIYEYLYCCKWDSRGRFIATKAIR